MADALWPSLYRRLVNRLNRHSSNLDDAADRSEKQRFHDRWLEVVEAWPPTRFFPTTDLDPGEAACRQLKTIHDWRYLVPVFMRRLGIPAGLTHAYCFGTASGGTVADLVTAFRIAGAPLPHLHLFDSFQGLPPERPGVMVPPNWTEGAFAKPLEGFAAKLTALGISPDAYEVFPGWFSETLDSRLVETGRFEPAAYVDIDADLYGSTLEVLDFLFAHGLIRPGTLIGYDDWGDTELWTAGESRAHREMTEKYSAECIQLFSWGERPLIRKLFVVERIAGIGRTAQP